MPHNFYSTVQKSSCTFPPEIWVSATGGGVLALHGFKLTPKREHVTLLEWLLSSGVFAFG